jgi:hypothetical protein
MKKRILKSVTQLTLLASFTFVSNLSFAATSTDALWKQFKDSQAQKINIESEIKLAETTKLAFNVLHKQLADKKTELGKLQDQISFIDSNEKARLKKELAKLALLKKQISEIDGRLDTVGAIESLGIKNIDEVDAKVAELKNESVRLDPQLDKLKTELVLADSRFEKVEKIQKRRIEVQRKLDLINYMKQELNGQGSRFFTEGMVLTVSIFLIGEAADPRDPNMKASTTKALYAAGTVGAILSSYFLANDLITKHKFTKEIDRLQASYELDAKELNETFDAYSEILGIN